MYQIFICVIHFLVNLAESKKPIDKRQLEIWRFECELGVIVDSECPVDGGWSPWSSWSSCQGACDYVGHRKRTRECTNPPTSKDGTPCAGRNEEIESCFIMNCTAEDFRKLIELDVSRTEAMQQLEVVPALLERCLQMECPYESIEAALASDNTWHLDGETLWNSLQCVKHNIGCPRKGEWGMWGSWSACGARCGKGLRWRLRRCDTPPPSDATLICPSTPLQSEECIGEQCAFDSDYSDYVAGGTWSEWGKWSSCSENCGTGVRRRKRTCLESQIPLSSFAWGTHCRGQHDQLDICLNKRCSLDGGWSGWSHWGPCSQTCGAGKRSRTRSCTKPIPSGEGKNCEGLKTETESCYLKPCEVYNHIVAILNGDSYLQYNLSDKKFLLFHVYIRFMPLSPSGTLIRKGSLQSPFVRLSLQKWHICLDASGVPESCGLSRVCSSTALESAVWHSAMISLTSDTAVIRLDNGLVTIKRDFPCHRKLENSATPVYIGERFNGEIQEVILNFHRLKLMPDRDRNSRHSEYLSRYASNVAYEKANMAEAFLFLENGHYIRLPCFEVQGEWRMELTIKPEQESGLIIFMHDYIMENFFYITLQNMRIKIKLATAELRSESISSTDYEPNHWLDITLSKKRDINTIETTLNSGEILHLQMKENSIKIRCKALVVSTNYRKRRNKSKKSMSICDDEFFLGNIPQSVKNEISEDFPPYNGVIASLSINGKLIDLHNVSLERYKENKIQLSSRTASVSHTYYETVWGISNTLNLTCLHSKIIQTHSYPETHAQWFFLDTSLSQEDDKIVVDDGKILRLTIRKHSDTKGFYTCRGHSTKNTHNVITYGIIGDFNSNLNTPDCTTIIAVLTTVTLVVCTLSWLIYEGINDLRNGYGFFRDAHFSPQEEAKAICKYIDQNLNFFSSDSAVKLAKARARRKGKQLASRISFGAQEPQGLLQMETQVSEMINESSSSDLETLPALPEIKSSCLEMPKHVYRCDTNSYVVSPTSGLVMSPDPQHTSLEILPRGLCSGQLSKYVSKGKLRSRRDKDKCIRRQGGSYISKINVCTIKSQTFQNLSPAQKVLQKFYDLKRQDALE